MKWMNILLVVAGVFALTSCDEIFNENFEGKGPVVKRSLKLNNFDEIEVSNSMELYIKQGEKTSVIVKSHNNILDQVNAKVRSGRLELEMEPGNYHNVDIKVYVTVPTIKYIGGSGASYIEMSNFDRIRELELDFSGATEFKASGQETYVERLLVDISGAGSLRGFGLKCRRVDLDLSGASSCEVFATEILNLDISGASEVRYKGKPRISQDVSGASSVEAVD
jgi:hypothetical protein